MKKYTSGILKLCAVLLILVCAFWMQNQFNESSQISSKELPDLLQRGDKIQLGKEWDHVQNTYADLTRSIQSTNEDQSKIQLAQLFIKEARVTGEHGHYYPAALEMLDDVLDNEKLERDMKFIALMHKAGVQLSLHEFSDALKTGNEAARLNPSNAQIHGVLVDANVELGNYEKAVALADRMITIKPDIRSYSRVSYLREIHGDVEGSIEAMKLAAESGYPGFEETAWAMLTLGDLLTEYGRLDEAKYVYEAILETRENYPFAVGALANIHYLNGDHDTAEIMYKRAMDIIPEVGFYVELAKIYNEQGRASEKKALVDEILIMLQEDVDSGHNMNLEYADVYLNLMNDVKNAMKYVQKEYSKRPKNIDVNIAMAAIAKAEGDVEKQRKYAVLASKTNSQKPELKNMLAGL